MQMDNISTGALAWTLLLRIWHVVVPRDRSYHPERYYMRGRGPKWREKHSAQGRHIAL